MPNWCDNKLIIKGSQEDFQKFYSEHKNLDFNKILPIPTENVDLFNYRINTWGTKWNASDVVWEDNIVYFHTAWTPSIPIILQLASLYPSLSFYYAYYECGNQLAGYVYKDDFLNHYVTETVPQSLIPPFTISHGFETKEYWESRTLD